MTQDKKMYNKKFERFFNVVNFFAEKNWGFLEGDGFFTADLTDLKEDKKEEG